jgi:hypothetical protein
MSDADASDILKEIRITTHIYYMLFLFLFSINTPCFNGKVRRIHFRASNYIYSFNNQLKF